MRMPSRLATIVLAATTAVFLLSACSKSDKATAPLATTEKAAPAARVDADRLVKAENEPDQWLSHGRTYAEQRYSPLTQISADNVSKLGLAWTYKLDIDRGTEATPLIIDGVMYTTSAFSVVYALDPHNGNVLWKYDPEVAKATAGRGCCGPVNRGLAAWNGKLFLGAYDGRLIALDAKTGKPAWSVVTVDQTQNYTITGAPRVIKGKVIIGNGGAELGARGYVSAYDAETGAMAWRFYTVPGDPKNAPESDALEMARKTWSGDEYYKQGGGGTVWDSMAYDPELDLLYIGTGNGSPWNIKYRSEGKGDNLFLSSIVALKPDTGTYVWHYQTTPGDTWDYTATQHIVLADLKIDGKDRKVLMQAPKNGFFFVIDRSTGEFISAKNYVPTTWASSFDKSGKPVLTGEGDYSKGPKLVTPSAFGAHNWQPMSFNPQTGLVYIPAQFTAMLYEDFGQRPAVAPNLWNVGVAPIRLPDDPDQLAKLGVDGSRGMLVAWDPVQQKQAWAVDYQAPWNGGTLTTAGNLVFQGTADRKFVAYAADSGKLLWETPTNTGVIAAPITYRVDGEQYVTVMAGWGGTFATAVAGALEPQTRMQPESRILTYKLGAAGTLPAPRNLPVTVPQPPEVTATPEQLAIGKDLYHGVCAACHGIAGISSGLVPDLRYMSPQTHAEFNAIVAGARAVRGMPPFGHVLPPEQMELIHQYLAQQSHALLKHVEPAAETAKP